MAIVVEDGTGKADAESYIDVAYADTYHTGRNNTSWTALDTASKEAYLRRATDYMMQVYRSRWKGRRVLITQALDWPRVGVVLEDFGGTQGRYNFGSYGLFQVSYQIVPPEVQKACAELALRAITAPLAADLQQKVVKKQVGPIMVQYDDNSPQQIFYRAVDGFLKVLLLDGANGNMSRLSRS